jgi:hypothetical protein
VADQIQKVMGRRVSLHYEEKVGLPTSCFGETRHFVSRVQAELEMPGMTSPGPTAAPALPASAASR